MNKNQLKTGDLYLTGDSDDSHASHDMIIFLTNQVDNSLYQMYALGNCTKSLVIKNDMCSYKDFYYIFKDDIKIND